MGGGGPLRTAYIRQQLFFPDKRLIQYDCGKLQARRAGSAWIRVSVCVLAQEWSGENMP